MNEGYPIMNDSIDEQVRPSVDYGVIADEARQQHIQERATELNEKDRVRGDLIRVASMSDLATGAEWAGDISKNGAGSLNARQEGRYHHFIKCSVVNTAEGGQVGCMDGRILTLLMLLGPKMASGTHGNAIRLMLATVADPYEKQLNYRDAFNVMADIDQKYGFKSGTHALDQCGAQKFAPYAIQTVATQGKMVSGATKTFLGSVGYTYNQEKQSGLIVGAKQLIGLPESDKATQVLTSRNATACPNLPKSHKEKSIVVFMDHDVTLDNNHLVKLTTEELGIEAQAFGYSWGYHLKIAQELGGSLGDYYLHSVASQDVPVLTRLTDGSLDILAYKKN